MTPRVGAGKPASTWVQTVLAADTAAIYMGAGEAASIGQALIAAGKSSSTPAVLIENASLDHARIARGTLSELALLAAQLEDGPALIVLGEVLRNVASAAQPATLRTRRAR